MLSLSYRDNFHCFTLDLYYWEMPQENKPISLYKWVEERWSWASLFLLSEFGIYEMYSNFRFPDFLKLLFLLLLFIFVVVLLVSNMLKWSFDFRSAF